MKTSETKLKLFALLKQTPDLRLQKLVQGWNTPIGTLRRWRNEYNKVDTAEKLVSLVDVDEAIIEEAVDIVASKIEDAAPEIEDEIPKIDDEIPEIDLDWKPTVKIDATIELEENVTLDLEEDTKLLDAEDVTIELDSAKTMYEFRQLKTAKFREAFTGLKLLQGETQAIAGTVLNSIADRLDELDSMSASFKTAEIVSLTEALVNIQNAFFNKAVTNILVPGLSSAPEADDSLTSFRKRLTS